MATVNSAKIKLAYADATSRTYTFNGVDQTNLPDIKRKLIDLIDDINSNNENGQAFTETFVSDNGAKCVGITDARIIQTNQEVIYNAS